MRTAEPRSMRPITRAPGLGNTRAFFDGSFRWLITLCAISSLLLTLAILYELTDQAWPAIREFGLRFLWSDEWNPPKERFGAFAFIAGTLITSILALIFGSVFGVGAALFLAEIAPGWLRAPVSRVVELLAAIPSVVYGIWGVFVLGPWIQHTAGPIIIRYFGWLPYVDGPPLSVGIFGAVIILTIMILPTIVAISRDVIIAVPSSQREAVLALGATRWEMMWSVVLPYARSGILGASMLALARAVGETLAVALVIGNSTNVPDSIFSPAYTMASVIANQFREVENDMHLAALIYVALLLFLITFVINAVARLLVWRVTKGVRATVYE